MFRRDSHIKPPLGYIIAEFDCGKDAVDFITYCKDDTYSVTAGINRVFAVRKMRQTLSQIEPLERV